MTAEKSQVSMTISRLPSECFDEIFKHLKFDRRSLYSCLFVNRFWCRKVIPIIWRRPMPYNPMRAKIIDVGVFIPFFNEEEKSCLEGHDISLPERPLPLFNYAQYIHILDIGAIEKAIENWILRFKQPEDSLSRPRTKVVLNDESKIKAAMIDSLCKMFMRSASNLKYLILSPHLPDKDIPKSDIFVGNEPGLANLRKLKLRFYVNSINQHEYNQRENLYNLLKSLPTVCNGLVHLDINRIKIPNCVVTGILAGLITSQPELTYCRFYKVFGDTSMLMGVLPAHKLMSLVLDDMVLYGNSLAPLSQCTRLESLVLKRCRSLTLESIQPILKASIKLKFLYLSELPKDVMKAIIIKASDTLEQVSIRCASADLNEEVETLVNHCQNTTHLSLSSFHDRVDVMGVMTLISLLKNLSHLKLNFDVYGNELENELSRLRLDKLQYLELISIKHLQGHFFKCSSPLSTIIIDIIEKEKFETFLGFSKEKSTIKWVGIDFIHGINNNNGSDEFSEVLKNWNEMSRGYFQVFHAKQVRIREKYF